MLVEFSALIHIYVPYIRAESKANVVLMEWDTCSDQG